MEANDFCAWLEHMGYSDSEAERKLGVTRKTIRGWREKGAPHYIALAASALAYGLPPWKTVS